MKKIAALLFLVTARIALAITAGPDAFGYSVTDSTEPGGPAFAYVDISTTGQEVVFPVSPADDTAGTIALSFPFPIYGQELLSLRVSSNGYISTDLSDPGTDRSNRSTLPSAPSAGGGARIYPLHDDLYVDTANPPRFPGPQGAVFFQGFASLPAHPFNSVTPVTIIQWQDVFHFGGGFIGKFSFQVLLFSDGSIYIAYPASIGNFLLESRATIGIQNDDATIGLLYSGNQDGTVTPPQAVAFTLAPPALESIRITDFRILNPATGEVTLTFDSTPGTPYFIEFSQTLDLSNPDSTITIPSNEVTGESTSRTFTLQPGHDFLRVRGGHS